jgi:predicted nuclease with TOPRIM domain
MSNELERAAYMAGDTATADLLARIDELQEKLDESIDDGEKLQKENDGLRATIYELRQDLDTMSLGMAAIEAQRKELQDELDERDDNA